MVTQLDHDANVTPWTLAARDQGVEVRTVKLHPQDCTLDLDDFRSKLSEKTRLVAVGAASNASGTVNPLPSMISAAHEVGALTYIDAVHYAPHRLIDVKAWDADFVAFSAYKFFGPHIGVLWGCRSLLESLEAYKVRPAANTLPDKWMTGTQSHESIMGAKECVEYLADLGRECSGDSDLTRRSALAKAFEEIQQYEQALCQRLIDGLQAIEGIRIWGIQEAERMQERLPTISITHDNMLTTELARKLGENGVFAWNGHYYAIQLTEALGLEPEGMIRLGLVHYNTAEEVDRLLEILARIVQA
jgi:cysteine desulfurase family protein (TIGR01976 family)